MTYIKHIGIYVNDIEVEKNFYKNVFGMEVICDALCDQNEMLCELFHDGKGKAYITKLITPLGKKAGVGEMVELVKVDGGEIEGTLLREIFEPGTAHICFGVDNLEQILGKVKVNNGVQRTQIYELGERCCSFCTDPEGNWIEIIS